MKYIKTYKLFEDFIIQNPFNITPEYIPEYDTIMDRLIDLSDNGFSIRLTQYDKDNYKRQPTRTIAVRIERPNYARLSHVNGHGFKIEEVLNDITSLALDMDSEYSLGVELSYNGPYNEVRKPIGKTHIEYLNDIKDNSVSGIELYFYKRKKTKTNENKIFESSYDEIRRSNSGLEHLFKQYDETIKGINKMYDNVSIRHRGNKFYDIYYSFDEKNSLHETNTIHIGTYDVAAKTYHLFECRRLSEYSTQGCDYWKVDTWSDELNEDSFDRFVNKWYDIYDKY